jgi:TolA-binding protein
LDVPRPDVSSAVDPSDVARAESSATESDVTERGVARAESSATESDATERGVARNATVAERAEPEWRTLAKAGKLKEAFTSAESQGFARLCESASAPDLLLLGDAARLSGRPDRATLALQSLRNRFPSDSRRAAAAFALGKVAFDQRRTYSEAAKWFSTSLQEQPNGSLSREASGRLIEALRNAGDLVGAERAARSYLSKYPEGPHATVARAVLQ